MDNEIKIYILDMSKLKLDNDTKHQREKTASEYLIKTFISENEIKRNEFGKPYIDGDIKFNISHSNDYCILAISNYEIGVDIEYVKKRSANLESRIFSDEEKKNLTDIHSFYKMWTSKESLVKCIGTGIISNIKEIPSLPVDGEKTYKGVICYSQNYTFNENYEISVTIMHTKKLEIKNIIVE